MSCRRRFGSLLVCPRDVFRALNNEPPFVVVVVVVVDSVEPRMRFRFLLSCFRDVSLSRAE